MVDKSQNSVVVGFTATQLTHKLQDHALKHAESLRNGGLLTDNEVIAICVLAAEKLLATFKEAAEYVNVDYQNV